MHFHRLKGSLHPHATNIHCGVVVSLSNNTKHSTVILTSF